MVKIKDFSRFGFTLGVLSLIMIWNIATWFIAESYFRSGVEELISQESVRTQQRAADLADSIQRNLNYMSGIPDLLGELLRVKRAVSRFGADAVPSGLPIEQRRQRWIADPDLNDLSRYLALAQSSLKVDVVYVVNAAGDAIASSNWESEQTTIGANFADRDFFKNNKNGMRGMQYAVGKTTHVPGLFFATPVVMNGKFMGSVVAKIDVPNLSFLTKQIDTFVVDRNGVIVLARDKTLEMKALSGAAVFGMDEREKSAVYQKTDFSELKVASWGDARFPALLHVEKENFPQLQAGVDLPEFGLKVYVQNDLPSIQVMERDRLWSMALLGALGSALILVAGAVLLYLRAIRRSRVMLWNQANFDALTGLPNRAMFGDRLAQELKKTDRSGQTLALLLIDLDHFKEVNDTLGHAMGDLLLQETARRMMECVRESDTVARLGGDEFTVVLPQLSDPKYAEDIARKIIRALLEPFQLQGHTAHVSASIGISLYPHDAIDIDHLIRNADEAMYAAKNAGRNNFSYFHAQP